MKSQAREVEVLLHLAENLDRELFFLTADKAILEGTFPHAEPARVRDSLNDVLKGLLEYLVIGFLHWKDGSGELSLLVGGPVSQDFLEQFALHIVNEAEKAFECRIRPEDVSSTVPLDLTHSVERSFPGSICSVPVPLPDTGQVLVAVAHDKPAALPADSCEILRRAAPSIRMVLANAELAQRIRIERENVRTLLQRVIETQEWEKKRIADQVHDSLVQPLIGILAGLRFISRGSRRKFAQPDKLMGEALEALSACVTQGRRMIFELHPPLLEQLGLVPLIREYVGHLSGEESFTAHLSVRGSIRRLSPII
ncbi:MAG: hypothetical protein HYU64_01755, partial [Armatimonadetes bacterium]|nr:hypothetical protein [Armatimonadota bacterium]